MKRNMKKMLLAILSTVMALSLVACGGSTSVDKSSSEEVNHTTQSVAHLYDRAVEKPVMNGVRTESIGEYSVTKADSSECTDEAIADWYYNYVAKHDFNYCLIVYTDKDEEYGCYSIDGMVQKDIEIEMDEYGDYSMGSSPDMVTYIPSDDGETLTALESSD